MKYLLLFLLTACSSGYYARGFWGDGYSEIQTNPDSFIVTYNGNQYTHPDDVYRYSLLRASELTLRNGYNYFLVLNTEDQSHHSHHSYTRENVQATADARKTPHTAHALAQGSRSTSTHTETVLRPGKSLRIQCFKENPNTADTIDASFYWNANSVK